jgi:hypothetical protein
MEHAGCALHRGRAEQHKLVYSVWSTTGSIRHKRGTGACRQGRGRGRRRRGANANGSLPGAARTLGGRGSGLCRLIREELAGGRPHASRADLGVDVRQNLPAPAGCHANDSPGVRAAQRTCGVLSPKAYSELVAGVSPRPNSTRGALRSGETHTLPCCMTGRGEPITGLDAVPWRRGEFHAHPLRAPGRHTHRLSPLSAP